MVERKFTFRQKLSKGSRAHLSAHYHQFLRAIAEIPFAVRSIRAPQGRIVRGGETKAEGKIVRYSGDSYVILTENWEMVFPNEKAGDVVRPPSQG